MYEGHNGVNCLAYNDGFLVLQPYKLQNIND